MHDDGTYNVYIAMARVHIRSPSGVFFFPPPPRSLFLSLLSSLPVVFPRFGFLASVLCLSRNDYNIHTHTAGQGQRTGVTFGIEYTPADKISDDIAVRGLLCVP